MLIKIILTQAMVCQFAVVPSRCPIAMPEMTVWWNMTGDQDRRVTSGETTISILLPAHGQVKTFRTTKDEFFGAVLWRDTVGGPLDILVRAGPLDFAKVLVFVNQAMGSVVRVTCVLENGDMVYRSLFDNDEVITFKGLESRVLAAMALQGIGDYRTIVAFRRATNFQTVRPTDLVFKPKGHDNWTPAFLIRSPADSPRVA